MEDLKQHIIAPLAGISNTPSDYAAEDTLTALTEGLKYTDGELKPIQYINAPEGITTNLDLTKYKLVFVHDYNNIVRYIFTDGTTLVYLKKGTTTTVSLGDYQGITKVCAIGNTLIALYKDGLMYATWAGTDYTISSTTVKPRYSFYLKYNTVKQDDEDYLCTNNDVNNILRVESDENTKLGLHEGATMYDVKNLIIGLWAEAKNKVYKQKKFHSPFFAVAALKLYDGSYKYIGAPQLMYTLFDGYLWDFPYSVVDNYTSVDLQRIIPHGAWTLGLTQMQDLSKANVTINGISIFTSIDIFVTRPVDLYEFNEIDTDDWWLPWSQQANGALASLTRLKLVDNSNQKAYYWDTASSPLWSDGAHTDSRTFQFLKWRTTKDIKQDLFDNLGQFRKIASIPFGTDGIFADGVDEYMSDTTLQTLDNQTLLTFSDRYKEWCDTVPEDIYTINRRLLKVAGTRTFCKPFTNTALIYAGNSSASATYKFVLTLQTSQGEKKIITKVSDTDRIYNTQMWYYHPDPRATKLTIYKDDSELLAITFLHNSPIGGAYYLGDYPDDYLSNSSSSVSEWGDETDNSNDTEDLPNQIVQGLVDDPFNDDGNAAAVTVSQGNIIGIGTLTTALTQDAYKVATVLVFTSQGIWALNTGTNGAFTNVTPPFSREVCINKNTIVQTDDKIYFATAKGINCIVAATDGGVQLACSKLSLQGTRPTFDIEYYSGKVSVNLYQRYLEINNAGFYAYDYNNQAILLLQQGKADAFVYDMATGSIYYMLNILSYRPSDTCKVLAYCTHFPDTLIQATRNIDVTDKEPGSSTGTETSIYSLMNTPARTEDTLYYKGTIISRPLKLDGALYLKSLRRVRKLGLLADMSNLKLFIEGSNDLINWATIPSLGGKPYKFFRYTLKDYTFKATDTIDGLLLNTQVRYTERPR